MTNNDLRNALEPQTSQDVVGATGRRRLEFLLMPIRILNRFGTPAEPQHKSGKQSSDLSICDFG